MSSIMYARGCGQHSEQSSEANPCRVGRRVGVVESLPEFVVPDVQQPCTQLVENDLIFTVVPLTILHSVEVAPATASTPPLSTLSADPAK